MHELKSGVTEVEQQEIFARALQFTEEAMLNVVNSDVTVLRDASNHILQAGGKRVRPRLLILAYLAAGGIDPEYPAAPAAAIELMHTASVVHDDINDHGIVRRGRPSVNAIWGRTFALLTGDFLFTTVYQLMAPYGTLNQDLANAATGLVEGETLQAWAVKNNEFTSENYMRIIALKTAALFKAAGAIGAKLAGAREEVVLALSNYAYNIGLAFQIVDDILDIIGDEEKLGKTAGIDIEQGRGIASVVPADGSQNSDDVMESIKQKLLGGNRLEKAQQQAQMLVQIAINGLDVLPDSLAKTELIDLADKVINRDH